MGRSITYAILVVSDTCARNESEDKTGPRLEQVFSSQTAREWVLKARTICADEVTDIQRIVRSWADDAAIDVILTSGGTGFAVRDVTPEAIKPLLDKEAPGLIHAMFRTSFNITPFAAMARLVAGIRKSSIIITVPGSVKGAVENVEAIIKLLPHASDLATDCQTSRSIHADGPTKIAKDLGLESSQTTSPASHHSSHHCHHLTSRMISNDPSLPVTQRSRESPYTMVPVSDALDLVLQNTPDPIPIELALYGNQRDYMLTDHFAAEDVYARENVPSYRASIVDGYAVLASDGPGVYSVVSVSHAKADTAEAMKSAQIIRITTGAPLPPGADAVVMVEDTKLISSTAEGDEESEVEILAQAVPNDNIREIGSDLEKGALVMSRGERISATGGEIGVIASAGHSSLKVYRKPIVGVLSTGDELVDPANARPLHPGEIRDTNRISLLSTLRAHHFSPVDLGIAKDVATSLEDVLRSAISRCDVIITTGGVSMGELDLLKPTIERSFHGTIHFGRVAMKPGKPTTFATIPRTKAGEMDQNPPPVMIFALPGNPASALVTCHLFVLPALRKMSSQTSLRSSMTTAQVVAPRIIVKLEHDIRLDPRPEFHRVTLRVSEAGILLATSTGMQRSSRVGSLKCSALLCLPARSATSPIMKTGDLCEAIMVDRL